MGDLIPQAVRMEVEHLRCNGVTHGGVAHVGLRRRVGLRPVGKVKVDRTPGVQAGIKYRGEHMVEPVVLHDGRVFHRGPV